MIFCGIEYTIVVSMIGIVVLMIVNGYLLKRVNGVYYVEVNGCLPKNAICVMRSVLHISILTYRFFNF